MKKAIFILRASVFNILLNGLTAIACILCIPFLFAPRKIVLGVVYSYVYTIEFLERAVLGLHSEIRGLKNLPKEGSFIVAAKHQSPYETFKLHVLFKDPAIILKKELLDIPVWGKFLARIDPLAIDRSIGKEAMQQIVDGAREIKKTGRPIIIFPQGTRVMPWQTTKDKPYKNGVSRMYEQADLPIIPLALNSGMFWPRRSWLKSSGTVTFSFLPPIHPGRDGHDVLKELEQVIETETQKLQQEALEKYDDVKRLYKPEEAKAS